MSRKGNCWDNAPTESFWGRLKTACIHGYRFTSKEQARWATWTGWLSTITADCIQAWAISVRCSTSNAGMRHSVKRPRKWKAKNSKKRGQHQSSTGGYCVSAEEALRWLKDKKGFVPTRSHVHLSDELQWPPTISSLTEMRVMLNQKMIAMGLTVESLANTIGQSPERLREKLSEAAPLTFQDALPLAKALQIDPPTLLKQIMLLCHPDEAHLLMSTK